MEILLVIEEKKGSRPLTFAYTRMVNAGYVGKNQEEVRRHIRELAAKGIAGPLRTPTLYPVVCKALSRDAAIEVYGRETSGEVEYVLLVVDEKEVYVGIGSDHTDRRLEEIDIPRAKQICPNLIGERVWPLHEVAAHWDDLLMRSKVVKDGQNILYQEGRLGLLLNPAELMDFVKTKLAGPLKNFIIFSGTMGMLTGEFVFGERFAVELIDEKLDRRLAFSYDVHPLDYLEVDK